MLSFINPSRRVYNEGVTPNESYYVPRRNEGWATHGLPFREMPASGTGENRMAVALPAQSHKRVVSPEHTCLELILVYGTPEEVK